MPQEPKKKHSKARKRTRRAAIILSKMALVRCSHCGQMTLPHQACQKCGYYKNKQIKAKTKAKITKA